MEWQLRIAAGAHLDLQAEPGGHAIEARLYAEHPVTFLPEIGTIRALSLPDGVRVDTGIAPGRPRIDPLRPSGGQAHRTWARPRQRTRSAGRGTRAHAGARRRHERRAAPLDRRPRRLPRRAGADRLSRAQPAARTNSPCAGGMAGLLSTRARCRAVTARTPRAAERGSSASGRHHERRRRDGHAGRGADARHGPRRVRDRWPERRRRASRSWSSRR